MFTSPIKYALRAMSSFFPIQKPMLLSGQGSMLKIAKLMTASGHKKPLIMTTDFLLRNNMLDELQAYFASENIEVTIYSGCKPNPTMNEVEEALALSKANGCDVVLAIGGGSVIDVAKVVAAASTDERDVSKLIGILKVKQAPLPFYVVPTTSGTGSETTAAAVISDSATHKKMFFVDRQYIPSVAAIDPDILKTLPAAMTAAVGMDALTHAIEAFTSLNKFNDTDRDAKMAIKLLFDYLPKAFENGEDLEARELVAQASFLAGYAFSKASLGYVHAISHQISAHYNTPHGLANAIILPRIVRFNKDVSAKHFAELAIMLGEDVSQSEEVLAEQFIKRLDELAKQVEIPQNLSDIQEKDMAQITKAARSEASSSYAVPKSMKHKDVMAVLKSVSNGGLELEY